MVDKIARFFAICVLVSVLTLGFGRSVGKQTRPTPSKQVANPFSKEVDTVYQQSKSPDGRYVARLLYRENLAMTYGFFHVTIQPLRPNGKPVDLIEVAAEGLSGIAWKGPRKLVITYDGTKHRDKLEDTLFVKRPKSWRQVKIVYRPM